MDTRVRSVLPIPSDSFRTEIVDRSANVDDCGGKLRGGHRRVVVGANGKRDCEYFKV